MNNIAHILTGDHGLRYQFSLNLELNRIWQRIWQWIWQRVPIVSSGHGVMGQSRGQSRGQFQEKIGQRRSP